MVNGAHLFSFGFIMLILNSLKGNVAGGISFPGAASGSQWQDTSKAHMVCSWGGQASWVYVHNKANREGCGNAFDPGSAVDGFFALGKGQGKEAKRPGSKNPMQVGGVQAAGRFDNAVGGAVGKASSVAVGSAGGNGAEFGSLAVGNLLWNKFQVVAVMVTVVARWYGLEVGIGVDGVVLVAMQPMAALHGSNAWLVASDKAYEQSF